MPVDRRELAKHISVSTVLIIVVHGEEILSKGSGIIFADDGSVMTAGHVIHKGKPYTQQELDDPTLKFYVKVKGHPPREYIQATPIIRIKNDFFGNEVIIDLVGLMPRAPWHLKLPFMFLTTTPPEIGDAVFMAGYSEETEFPFSFDRRLRTSLKGFSEFNSAMKSGYEVELGSLMIKSGIVGNLSGYSFGSESGGVTVKGFMFYVDNGMHRGASGGPIVTEDGKVAGIITERAMIRLSTNKITEFHVPSGSTLGLTVEPLLALPGTKIESR